MKVPDILAELGIENSDVDEWKANYNIAPTQYVPVVTDGMKLTTMRWGLVPHWAKEEKIGYSLINARAETVQVSNAFRQSFAERRCLVVCDGFYEWKAKDHKVPYAVVRRSKGLFTLAGVWDQWVTPGGKTLRTFTVITTKASQQLAAIHDRMPVIVADSARKSWFGAVADAEKLLKPSAERLIVYEVSKAVNVPANNSPELIVPIRK